MVARDYRTAQVFKKHHIDFCCKGNRTLEEVAQKQPIDLDGLRREINAVQAQAPQGQMDFASWSADLLADYIEKKHHRYVAQQLPVLKEYLDKVTRVHGAAHPELKEINALFTASAGELAMHMKKEELILFPYIRKMVQAQQQGETPGVPRFGTVKNPIATMQHEHDNEGERFRQIAKLSAQYTPPPDACATYKVSFALLREFEEDLHQHIHLENNILFPKAEALEDRLKA